MAASDAHSTVRRILAACLLFPLALAGAAIADAPTPPRPSSAPT